MGQRKGDLFVKICSKIWWGRSLGGENDSTSID
jgi:hypothetical protein